MSRLQDLHALINALSTAEKRSFRRFVGPLKKGESQTLVLFDSLSNKEVFDEPLIQQELKKKKIKRNLPTLMGRLREQILKSQRVLYASHKIDSRLYNALEEIDYLFNKRLNHQAMACVDRTAQMARRFSRTHHELILIGWKRRILLDMQPKGVQKAFHVLEESQKRVVHIQQQQLDLHNLQVQMHTLNKQVHQPRKQEEIAKYKALLDQLEAHTQESSTDFLCTIYAREIKGLYHMAMQEYPEAYALYKELVIDFRKTAGWIQDRPELFLSLFNNYQNALMYFSYDLSELEEGLVFLREIPLKMPNTRFRFHSISYQKELLMRMNQGRFAESEAFTEEVETWLTQHQEGLTHTRRLTFWYNLAVFYFFSDQFSRSNQFLNQIIQLEGKEERQDIRDFARVFQLILQHELGNGDLIEYLHRSAHRYLNRREKLSAFAKAILHWFKPERYTEWALEPTIAIQSLLTQLSSWRADHPDQTPPFGLEEVKLWCQSKLTDQSMQTVFAQRIKEVQEAEKAAK